MTILFIYIYIVQFLLIFIDTYHWLAFRCGQVSLCVGYSTWRGERCSVRGWPEFRWAESIPRSFTSQLPWQPDSFIKYNLHCFLSEPVNLPVTWTVDDLCALSTREEGRKRKRERERERESPWRRTSNDTRSVCLSLSHSLRLFPIVDLCLPLASHDHVTLAPVNRGRCQVSGSTSTSVCAGFKWV